MSTLPLWVRKALVDAIESAIASIFILNIVIPSTLDEAKAQGVIIGGAVAAASVAAARRAFPDFKVWLRSLFSVPAE